MGNIYPALFDIVFVVFSSDFVFMPGVLMFYSALFLVIIRIFRGRL